MSAGESNIRPRGSMQPRESVEREQKDGGSRPDQQEQRNLRRLQAMMQLLLATIAQDRTLTVDEAAILVARTRQSVLRLFPDKEAAYEMLCRPRIQRAMRERFLIQ